MTTCTQTFNFNDMKDNATTSPEIRKKIMSNHNETT